MQQTLSTFRWGLDEKTIAHYVGMVDDALNRYGGRLMEWPEQLDRDRINPLVWFREGIRAVILTPGFVLQSLGLWFGRPSRSLVPSTFTRVLSAIVSVIVLAAAVVQIVTGWDATLDRLRSWGFPVPDSHSIPTARTPPAK
jgi:hypothetical protein